MVHIALLLLCFLSVSKADEQSDFTDGAKSSFKARFVQSYSLRTGLNATNASLSNSPQQKNGFGSAKSQEWLDKAIEDYKTLMEEKKLSEVAIEGETQEMVHFAADEIWERTGGAFVD